MYEYLTYEQILQTMLALVTSHNPNVDTREGSVVWYGEAGSAVEIKNMYVQLDAILNETFADTATRYYLIKRAAERGLTPYPATKAVWKGVFTPSNLILEIGTRFNINELNFVITEQLDAGEYKLECETVGEIGNEYSGTLIPIDYVAGLESATLTELLIPGEDEEDTELFRQRYFNSLDSQAFGGNIADYIEKVNALSGVGGVKVYPVWNDDITPSALITPSGFAAWYAGLFNVPEEIATWLETVSGAGTDGKLTVGGTVRVVIIDSTWGVPSPTLISYVQSQIDPEPNHGEGVGIAPIGHFVTVEGVGSTTINVGFTLTFSTGWTWEDVEPYAKSALDAYFEELAQGWADDAESIVVRISQIDTRMLNLTGVSDIAGTTINGNAANLILGADNIPVRGTVVNT